MIEGGRFLMGSEQFYEDERPVVEVAVGPFEIDRSPVTNAEFARFVEESGYLTVAERPLEGPEFDHLPPLERAPGSLVFVGTPGPVDLSNWRAWWRWVQGANWRHPRGPDSGISEKANHPVVQVALADAEAFAVWAGRRLATEAEWEYAARGGLVGTTYAWGEDPHPNGTLMANTWQGAFPYSNTGAHGWAGTSPVGAFPPNGFGLNDMIGNVWEWTSSAYTSTHHAPGHSCCSGTLGDEPDGNRMVLKGGSHLCAPEYCLRYRPAARSPQTADTSTSHIGFRCVSDLVTQ
ncbi:MAG: formylglycine-generating enzyme family protein [Mycetocola sp.]